MTPSGPASVYRPTILTLVLAVTVLAGVVALFGRDGWWQAFAAASVAAIVATAVTLPLLASSLRLPPDLAGPRVLAVGMLRAMVTLGVAGAAVLVAETPMRPTALMAVGLYFALLTAETLAASRVVATQPPPTLPDASSNSDASPEPQA